MASLPSRSSVAAAQASSAATPCSMTDPSPRLSCASAARAASSSPSLAPKMRRRLRRSASPAGRRRVRAGLEEKDREISSFATPAASTTRRTTAGLTLAHITAIAPTTAIACSGRRTQSSLSARSRASQDSATAISYE
eukprot:scaffold7432_cov107-Isochrysis_galbana.AAC.13